ncbi:MAG: hypothetical protein R3C19_14185 [Planctomycetaceae bacterium]
MRPRHLAVLFCILGGSVAGAIADAADIVTFHGYDKAVELKNDAGVTVILCPQVGGRVLEYSLNGRNVLYVSDDEKNWKPGNRPPSSAGRFDIGPELIIPPREVLWSGEWTAEITGPRSARMTSQDDPNTGVRLIRSFTLAADSSKLTCTQTIMNVSDEPKEWCHWSRTFAVGKGLCFIPLTANSRFPNGYVLYEEGGLINMRPEDPAIVRRSDYLQIGPTPRKPKLGFDSYAGTIAYVAPNDLLFVKRFRTFPDRVYNEAAGLTISVWYPDNAMVELEPIGPANACSPASRRTSRKIGICRR